MGSSAFTHDAVMVIILALLLGLSIRAAYSQPQVPQQQQVPCFFIFGDSLVDNGNNNGILTLARANYMPYGIDFPQAQLLGFPNLIPPFARTRGPALLRGVNYASGAAGIRDETGNNLGDHLSMNQQVANFGRTVQLMTRMFRRNESSLGDYLSKCIFYSGMGSNDYLNNYFMPSFYSTSSNFSPTTFAAALLQDYSRQLTQLYQLGARKVVVTAVGGIGCIPYQLARYNGNGNGSSQCNEDINKAILLFNSGLLKMVDSFNKGRLPGAKFVYLNLFESAKDLVTNAASYGFEVFDKGCCGVGRNNGQITCLPLQQPCSDRQKYIFWDAFHPTEVANIVLAKKSYSSNSKSDVYPINIQKLAMLAVQTPKPRSGAPEDFFSPVGFLYSLSDSATTLAKSGDDTNSSQICLMTRSMVNLQNMNGEVVATGYIVIGKEGEMCHGEKVLPGERVPLCLGTVAAQGRDQSAMSTIADHSDMAADVGS
ncbi:Lipase [Macleaya cordata]|uniref:Lipase n=1 Tax=Macleaya cordata TaxID=56857 RepID=A0A200QC66_MACCD|nr:Lipase [Macleaya cordata]